MKSFQELQSVRKQLTNKIDELNSGPGAHVANREEKLALLKRRIDTLDSYLEDYTLYQFMHDDGVTLDDIITWTYSART